MKKPVHRAMQLADILNTLKEMETTCTELENSDVFQSLTTNQRAEYRALLSRLRYLVHDLEQDSAQEEVAHKESRHRTHGMGSVGRQRLSPYRTINVAVSDGISRDGFEAE